ncbi:MAG: gamma-glutamyltransferase family protein [Candidatus Entotheonellia bacterium]
MAEDVSELTDAGFSGRGRDRLTRPVVSGFRVIATSGNPLTTAAAIQVLSRGGNAIDAGVAAAVAAAVVEPTASYSLATEVTGLIYDATSQQIVAVNGQGCAPQRATIDLFRARGKSLIPVGPGADAPLSFTLPGAIDAWILALDQHGRLSLGEVLQPAIEYAEQGFPMYRYMSLLLKAPGVIEQLTRFFPQGAAYFHPNGRVPEPGERFVQTALANVLKKMVQAEEQARSRGRSAGLQAARDVFYTGEIAHAIVALSEEVGGLLSLEDFANYHSALEAPIQTTYRGIDVYGHRTWSQSATLLQTLNILEGFDLRSLGQNSPAYIHVLTEALKLAMADRERYYGDPDFVQVPLDALLSKEYAAERRKLIDLDKAAPELPAYGDPIAKRAVGGTMHLNGILGATGSSHDGTTHLSVVDAEGNIFTATPSGGRLGGGVVVPGMGFTLSHRSEIFYLDATHANALQPGKRPRTTLVCYYACKAGKPWLTFGCPGGDNQVQADLQLFLNVVEFGMNPQEAVEAPRFSSSSFPGSFYPHAYAPGQLNVERRLSGQLHEALALKGHRIHIVDNVGMGAIVTMIDPATGARSAGADPRRPTYAFGW